MSLQLFGAACTCCPVGAIGSSPDLTPPASDQGPTLTLNTDGTFGHAPGRDDSLRMCHFSEAAA